ncbi:hypothetical protein M0R45_025912 [Rubus argutus]|uniref:Uncharacterized protein n=1 Tax=Rubus argutus TaxID=59490 RepID=A0AAW1WW28_RUBAR
MVNLELVRWSEMGEGRGWWLIFGFDVFGEVVLDGFEVGLMIVAGLIERTDDGSGYSMRKPDWDGSKDRAWLDFVRLL